MKKQYFYKLFKSYVCSVAIAIIVFFFSSFLDLRLNSKIGGYVLFYFHPTISCWLGYIIINRNRKSYITQHRLFDYPIYCMIFLICSIFVKWIYIDIDLMVFFNKIFPSDIKIEAISFISGIFLVLIHPLIYLALIYLLFYLIIYFIFLLQNRFGKMIMAD